MLRNGDSPLIREGSNSKLGVWHSRNRKGTAWNKDATSSDSQAKQTTAAGATTHTNRLPAGSPAARRLNNLLATASNPERLIFQKPSIVWPGHVKFEAYTLLTGAVVTVDLGLSQVDLHHPKPVPPP